jgi:hypothetical protein
MVPSVGAIFIEVDVETIWIEGIAVNEPVVDES